VVGISAKNAYITATHKASVTKLIRILRRLYYNACILLNICLPNCQFPTGFSYNFICISLLSGACYMPCLSHPPWLDYPNIWRGVQITKWWLWRVPSSGIGDMFLRNVSWLSMDYKPIYHRWQNSSNYGVLHYAIHFSLPLLPPSKVQRTNIKSVQHIFLIKSGSK
jgi:hypothetical protein